jgi:hypothetical protein
MDSKFLLHRMMEQRFGVKTNKRTHSWLRDVTGKCHVSECTEQQLQKAIRRLRHVKVVRSSVWHRLETDRQGT